MTTILGIEHADGALLAADSMGSGGGSADTCVPSKLIRHGEIILGFTGSFRMGDLLRYHLELEPVPRSDMPRHIVTSVIPAIRAVYKDHGLATDNGGADACGALLIALRGRVYEVCPDYQVNRSAFGYNAVGSGSMVALGALSASAGTHMSPQTRAKAALVAAQKHATGTRPPWRFMSVPKGGRS